MPIQPRPMAETLAPERPSVRSGSSFMIGSPSRGFDVRNPGARYFERARSWVPSAMRFAHRFGATWLGFIVLATMAACGGSGSGGSGVPQEAGGADAMMSHDATANDGTG